jgi:hypothetical protein
MKNGNDRTWDRVNLKLDVATIPPGQYICVIADARIVEASARDTIWLFLTLEPISEDGEVLGQIEDKFITLAAAPNSTHVSRVPEGLRKLAIYGAATGLDFDGKETREIPEMLIGAKVKASVSRRGTGVHAENRLGAIGKVV